MSDISKYYEIQSKYELRQFVNDPYLAKNLRECINILLKCPNNNPWDIFGPIDTNKLQSSMTLFRHTKKFKKLAQKVLDKFFCGDLDYQSEHIIKTM